MVQNNVSQIIDLLVGSVSWPIGELQPGAFLERMTAVVTKAGTMHLWSECKGCVCE